MRMALGRAMYLMFWLALAVGHLAPANAETLEVVTEDLPPFSHVQDGQVTGIVTAIVRTVAERAGFNARIEVLPWARAMARAQSEPGTLIYTIARTAEREDKFKWVGPLLPRRLYLLSLASRTDIALHGLDDAKPYRIGVLVNDASARYLLDHGFEAGQNLDSSPAGEMIVRKLFAGRVDLMIANLWSYREAVRRLGYDPASVRLQLKLIDDPQGYWMALGSATPDALRQRLQAAVDSLGAEGRLAGMVDQAVASLASVAP